MSRERRKNTPEHIWIIGGSAAGLNAAMCLGSEYPNSHIHIAERDQYPTSPLSRPGVPQDKHTHVITGGGLKKYEKLYPELKADMDAVGSPVVHWAKDINVQYGPGKLPQTDYHFHTRHITRVGLEFLLREYVRRLGNVTIHNRVSVNGLSFTDSDTTVNGVFVKPSGESKLEKGYHPADAVIVATGRRGDFKRWLTEGHHTPPETIEVDSHLRYATAVWTNVDMDGAKLIGSSETVEHPRAGAVLQIEPSASGEQRFLSTLFTLGAHIDPQLVKTRDGYLSYAKAANPMIYEALQHARLISEVSLYENCQTVLTPYWNMSDFPDGLYPIGDVLGANNPRYGQGLSVAIQEALILLDIIANNDSSKEYLHRIKSPMMSARRLALASDYRFDSTTTKHGDKIVQAQVQNRK